jgi:hypothetical protein
MRDAQHIAVKSPAGITPERARDARARAWAYVFDCHANKEGRPTTSGPAKPTRRPERDDERKH